MPLDDFLPPPLPLVRCSSPSRAPPGITRWCFARPTFVPTVIYTIKLVEMKQMVVRRVMISHDVVSFTKNIFS